MDYVHTYKREHAAYTMRMRLSLQLYNYPLLGRERWDRIPVDIRTSRRGLELPAASCELRTELVGLGGGRRGASGEGLTGRCAENPARLERRRRRGGDGASISGPPERHAAGRVFPRRR